MTQLSHLCESLFREFGSESIGKYSLCTRMFYTVLFVLEKQKKTWKQSKIAINRKIYFENLLNEIVVVSNNILYLP